MRLLGFVGLAWCLLAVTAAAIWVWRNRHRCRECEDHDDIIAELQAEADAVWGAVSRVKLLDAVDRAKGWRQVHRFDKHPEHIDWWSAGGVEPTTKVSD